MPNEYLPIKVAIADDHPIFRDGFKFMAGRQKQNEIELVGEAENGKELLEIVAKVVPDVVVTDIKMPVMDGIEASREIKKNFPSVEVIAMSMYNEEHLIMDMFGTGAKGYLLKNEKKEDILQAIKVVKHGGHYYSNSTSKRLIELIVQSRYHTFHQLKAVSFSKQEVSIIQFIAKEMTSKEIAGELRLSARTVEDYRHKIQEKTGARCAVGIVIYALRHNIITLSEI